jgi:hypothetical protein
MWYAKPCGGHGDRWVIEIKGKYEWKTTSSKNITTKCKFELAKKHLRNLMHNNPDLFKEHAINGELNEEGKRLQQEYFEIIDLAKPKLDMNVYRIQSNVEKGVEDTIVYLEKDITGLTEAEIALLQNDTSKEKVKPQGGMYELPKYCCYIKETKDKGDGFYVARYHPKQNGKDWCTTRSKKVSLDEKYKQLQEYLNSISSQPNG